VGAMLPIVFIDCNEKYVIGSGIQYRFIANISIILPTLYGFRRLKNENRLIYLSRKMTTHQFD
jgi:hypothetical protein